MFPKCYFDDQIMVLCFNAQLLLVMSRNYRIYIYSSASATSSRCMRVDGSVIQPWALLRHPLAGSYWGIHCLEPAQAVSGWALLRYPLVGPYWGIHFLGHTEAPTVWALPRHCQAVPYWDSLWLQHQPCPVQSLASLAQMQERARGHASTHFPSRWG